jgi:hypothetical protein
LSGCRDFVFRTSTITRRVGSSRTLISRGADSRATLRQTVRGVAGDPRARAEDRRSRSPSRHAHAGPSGLDVARIIAGDRTLSGTRIAPHLACDRIATDVSLDVGVVDR